MDLKNKISIVTGASRGIGKSIALKLAGKGSHLALIARNERDLLQVTEECAEYGVHVRYYPFDLTQIDHIPELVQKIKQDFTQVDILINDAGKYMEADPFADELDEWDNTLDLNFRAVYHLTNGVLKIFPKNKEGAVINICSISGLTITHGGEIYNSSKAALKGFAGCLFESIREKGIKVTTIYPGYVNTNMAAGDGNKTKMIQPDDVASAVLWSLQLPHNTCATDITLRPQRSPAI